MRTYAKPFWFLLGFWASHWYIIIQFFKNLGIQLLGFLKILYTYSLPNLCILH